MFKQPPNLLSPTVSPGQLKLASKRPSAQTEWMGHALRFLSLAVLLAGCPSPARVRCIDACTTEHDRCMLAARNGEALQECDEGARACVRGCPL